MDRVCEHTYYDLAIISAQLEISVRNLYKSQNSVTDTVTIVMEAHDPTGIA